MRVCGWRADQIRERSDLAKETMKEDYNAVYWNQRYTVREDQVPVFLQKHAETIVTTGNSFQALLDTFPWQLLDCRF